MGQPYSSGVWIAKSGREAEFVAAWHEFADWSLTTIKGGSWAKLLQDRTQSNRFVSFGPWDSHEQIEAWRSHAGFAERVGRIRRLIESVEPSTLEAVVEVGMGPPTRLDGDLASLQDNCAPRPAVGRAWPKPGASRHRSTGVCERCVSTVARGGVARTSVAHLIII